MYTNLRDLQNGTGRASDDESWSSQGMGADEDGLTADELQRAKNASALLSKRLIVPLKPEELYSLIETSKPKFTEEVIKAIVEFVGTIQIEVTDAAPDTKASNEQDIELGEYGAPGASDSAIANMLANQRNKNMGGAQMGAESPAGDDDDNFNVSDDENYKSVNIYSSNYGRVSVADSDEEKADCSFIAYKDVTKNMKCTVTCSFSQIYEQCKKRIQLGAQAFLSSLSESDVNLFRGAKVIVTDYEINYEIAEIKLRDNAADTGYIFEDDQDENFVKKIWLPWKCLIEDEDSMEDYVESMYALD